MRHRCCCAKDEEVFILQDDLVRMCRGLWHSAKQPKVSSPSTVGFLWHLSQAAFSVAALVGKEGGGKGGESSKPAMPRLCTAQGSDTRAAQSSQQLWIRRFRCSKNVILLFSLIFLS